MDPTVEVALIGLASGLLTLLIGEGFRRWRSRADRIRDDNVEADTDHKTMDALTAAFRTIADRQADDITDLRERLRRVEDALLVAQQRSDALAKENAELREDRDAWRARADMAEGEVRQLKQLAASASRVYGQDEDVEETVAQ